MKEEVAEMICLANGDRFEKLSDSKRDSVMSWAESIITYVKER